MPTFQTLNILKTTLLASPLRSVVSKAIQQPSVYRKLTFGNNASPFTMRSYPYTGYSKQGWLDLAQWKSPATYYRHQTAMHLFTDTSIWVDKNTHMYCFNSIRRGKLPLFNMIDDWGQPEREAHRLQFKLNKNALEAILKTRSLPIEQQHPLKLAEPLKEKAPAKHWIFFFDINNTIYMGDSAINQDKALSICEILAYNYSAIWDSNIAQPMSFHDYVTKHVCPGNKNDPVIRSQQALYFKNFIPFLKGEFPLPTKQASGTQHPLAAEVEQQYEKMSLALKDGNILPSFIQFIEFLNKEHYTYTIIFRSMGKDIAQVKQELAAKTSLTTQNHGVFKQGQLTLDDGRILKTSAEMLSSIQPFAHAEWDDSFEDWKASNRTYAGGKPFPIDLTNQNVTPVFFDDNVKYQILCIKPCSDEAVNQEALHQALMASGNVVHVDPLDACLDPDYFISKLRFAEKKLNVTASPPNLQDARPSPDGCLSVQGLFARKIPNTDERSGVQPYEKSSICRLASHSI